MALEALKKLFRIKKRDDGLPLLPRGPLNPGQLRTAYLSTLRHSLDIIEEEMASITERWNVLDKRAAELRAVITKYERKE